jgi:ferredoxin-NADP reductase
MTASLLLTLIVAALTLQLAVFAGLAFLRRTRVLVAPPGPQPAAATTSAWSGWREFRVARREFEDGGASQCSFYLEPVDGVQLPAFKPGQFLTFQLPVLDPAAQQVRPVTRCYSLSDRPESTHYRITVKRVPAPATRPDLAAGAASSHLHDHVHVGDLLQVKAPSGHFHIDPDPAVPVVLVGGGIGITPMMSMLRWIIAEQPGRPVHLFYGVRCAEDQAFKPVLAELAATRAQFKLVVVHGRPAADAVQGRDFHHAGHVDIDLLKRSLPHGRHQFYVCGPPAMMESLVPALASWGVPEEDIHFEAFGPASVKLPRAAAQEAAAGPLAAFDVHFQRSGRSLAWDGRDESLLDFAERHAVAVESGCRSGGCGSCQTRLLSGSVSYAHPPDHDIAPGHCLLCVGKPASALVLEA